MTTVTNDPYQQIQDIMAQWASQQGDLKALTDAIKHFQDLIASLAAQIDNCDSQLSDLQKQKDKATTPEQKKAIQDKIDEVTHHKEDLKHQLENAKKELAAKQEASAKATSSYSAAASTASQNIQDTQKHLQQSDKKQAENNLKNVAPLPHTDTVKEGNRKQLENNCNAVEPPLTPEELAKRTIDQINELSANIDKLNADMREEEDLIIADHKNIADYSSKIEAVRHRIIMDSIAIGCSFGLDIFADIDLADAIKERDDLESKRANAEKDAAAKTTDLDAKISKMDVLIGSLMSLQMSQIQARVASILSSVLDALNSGKGAEGALQTAAAALELVMADLQNLLATVHNKRAEDKQEMSRLTSDNYSMAVNQSLDDIKSLIESIGFSKVIKVLVTVAEILMAVAALALAVVTGGALAILIAVVMAVMTAINLATDHDYAAEGIKELAKLFDKDGSAFAQFLVAVAVVVLIVMATILTEGRAAANVALEAAEAGAEEGLEIEMQEIGAQAASRIVLEAVEASAEAASEAAVEAVEELGAGSVRLAGSFAGEAGEAAGDAAASAARTTVGTTSRGAIAIKAAKLGTMGFMMTGGLVNGMQAIWQKASGLSQEELEKQEIFQMMKMIAGLTQALVGALAGASAFGGGGTAAKNGFMQQLGDKLGNYLNPRTVRIFAGALGGLGAFTGAVANSIQAKNADTLADIYDNLGAKKANMLVLQSILDANKAYEKEDSEKAAVDLQQIAAELQEMVKKAALAENAAARMISEMAV